MYVLIGCFVDQVVLTVQDPSEETKTGYHGSSFVSVWCRDNRQVNITMTLKLFVREALKKTTKHMENSISWGGGPEGSFSICYHGRIKMHKKPF